MPAPVERQCARRRSLRPPRWGSEESAAHGHVTAVAASATTTGTVQRAGSASTATETARTHAFPRTVTQTPIAKTGSAGSWATRARSGAPLPERSALAMLACPPRPRMAWRVDQGCTAYSAGAVRPAMWRPSARREPDAFRLAMKVRPVFPTATITNIPARRESAAFRCPEASPCVRDFQKQTASITLALRAGPVSPVSVTTPRTHFASWSAILSPVKNARTDIAAALLAAAASAIRAARLTAARPASRAGPAAP